MMSRGQLEIAKPENSSWMPRALQGVTGLDDDDNDDDDDDDDMFRRVRNRQFLPLAVSRFSIRPQEKGCKNCDI